MIRLYCDRCATEIRDYRDGLVTEDTGNFRVRVVVSIYKPNGLWDDQGHLCQRCIRELITAPPSDPATKTMTLCTHPDRRDGEVTVGESRLPAVEVLGTVRSFGVAGAESVWPQLTEADLAVIQRLVRDIAELAQPELPEAGDLDA
jgi:hypothetical protein